MCHNLPVEGWGATMIGRLLDGRYRIVEVLGSGAFGRTYLAEDTHRPGHPQCVVKQLQPPSDNPQLFKTAHRLFRQEAETLEKLGRHDQIPQLLAYFEDSKQFYLVEEFVPGSPLAKEIVPGSPLSDTKIVSLLQEVLEVLVFVHGQGVIHRDVNPSNIIRRQPDGKLVLIDFGSVKEVSTQVITSNGQIPRTIATGTPAYMPIEQFQGNPQFSSDIYAVGMIAIQAATGLQASDLPKLQSSKIQDPQAHVGKVAWRHRARVESGLADIIDRMVCSYFGHRYQSATEVLADLQQLSAVGDKPIEEPSGKATVTTSELNPPQPLMKKSRLLAIALGTTLFFLGGLAFSFYNRLPQRLLAHYYVIQGIDKSQKGNSQEALDDFTKAIQIDPQNDVAYVNRGKVRFDLGDDKGALKDCDQAIEINPHSSQAYNNRGNIRAALGNEQGAIQDYTQAIALEPQLARAYLNRCLSRSNLDNQKGAIEDCTRAIQLKPNYAFAYQNRGLARRRKGDLQGAIEDYNIGIRINPQDADPYYNRGLTRADLGERQGALEDFSQAIRLNPTHALAYYDRGIVRIGLGDRRGAIEDLQQSAKLCLNQGKLDCYKDAQYQITKLGN